MSPEDICVLCNHAVTSFHRIEGDWYSVECKICGRYESTDLHDMHFKSLPEEERAIVKRRDILRVNRRIHLRVGADECSYIFEKDILRVSSENRLNEA